MVLNVHRNRDGEKMEVVEEGDMYISLYTVTTRMTPALR